MLIPALLVLFAGLLLALAFLFTRRNARRLSERIEAYKEETAKNPVNPYQALGELYQEPEQQEKGKHQR